jgi:L-rhamnose isomerase
LKDAVESKVFGIGTESYVVGSHEFYFGYAATRKTLLCLDMGHFHPTESVADKISSTLLFIDEILLHVSRGIRWDSDHVVIYNDELVNLALEIIRSGKLDKIHIGLDFFDGSINRVGAWAIGSRATLKALLFALLEPRSLLIGYEGAGNNVARLALMEQMKSLPLGAVWDYYCESSGVTGDDQLIAAILEYEKTVTAKRG